MSVNEQLYNILQATGHNHFYYSEDLNVLLDENTKAVLNPADEDEDAYYVYKVLNMHANFSLYGSKSLDKYAVIPRTEFQPNAIPWDKAVSEHRLLKGAVIGAILEVYGDVYGKNIQVHLAGH